ncbi:ATP-binding protein (plasmid) [Hymenobacter tibetensis]|uniref:histidine kinase n=1 Tax=Hymenobacter tibetensis TaxID=497967 RepID=A0ABY4D4Z4_9BACT|nr:ATP-binding protein [Hymenobacter tibetensis]UOG77356.1 ATP-binding protein [Hymenobacter tibetensis]
MTWLFVGIVAFILLAAMGVVYVLQVKSTNVEFRQRLRDRAELTGYIFLERDEVKTDAFRAFQRRYLRTLPGEVLQVYDAQLQPRFIEQDHRIQISHQLLARIVTQKEVYFEIGVQQAVGVFYQDNQGDYVIVAAAENSSGRARLKSLATILVSISLGSLLVIYVAGWGFAGRVLAPIAAVNNQVNRITSHDLHLRLSESKKDKQDEIARLVRTFNRMLDRLEDGFESQRAFVTNASHELRTPLTAAIGELQVLLTRDREPAAYQEALASVLDEMQQMKLLVNNLLELTQATGTQAGTDSIRLDELLWETHNAVDRTQRHRVVLTIEELPATTDQLEIQGNRQLLYRAFTNLLDNALKYSGGQPVAVQFGLQDNWVYLRITDMGIGIPAKDLDYIFQPFFRSANARGFTGHGVGLALARRIIELHGGRLQIESALGSGTTATVTFGALAA